MANREEIKEEVARYFYDEKARVTPGTSTYPFWLIRTKIRRIK